MMALTPKRLFLYRCISISLLLPYTLFSRSPLVNKTLYYTGLTAHTFKQHYNAHQQSMRNNRYRHSTSLSKHLWALKDKQIGYNIQWSVLRKAKEYQNTTKRCNLCLAEKLEIIMANKERSLNRRSELISKCRHENQFYLSGFQPPVS